MRVPVFLILVVLLAIAATSGTPADAAATRAGDVVFVIDQSSSMGDEIADVKSRVGEIVSAFQGEIDARFGLVGFGGAEPNQPVEEPYTRVNLTDASGFRQALDGMGSYGVPGPQGSSERGVYATEYAATQVTGYRAGSGACIVLITDEEPKFHVDEATDLARAQAALSARNAVFFAIADTTSSVSRRTYGPGGGSLAATTGGAIFGIGAFRSNGQPVLASLLSKCARALQERASSAAFTVTPTSGEAPLDVRFDAVTGADITAYSWSFGDGATASGTSERHTYGQPGSYVAQLTVTTGGGTSSASETIVVRAASGGGPGPAGGPTTPSEDPTVHPTDCTIVGSSGNDVLLGTPGRDVICGLGGRDTIRALGGRDVLVGGAGNDVLKGGAGNDVIWGGPGNDLLFGEAGADRLLGEAGRDRLVGGGGNDVLRAGGGNDLLLGGLGRDVLMGGAGLDRLLAADRLRDVLHGGTGRDRATADRRIDAVRAVEAIRRR